MAGRAFLFQRLRRTARPAMALLAVLVLIAVSVAGLRQALAERAPRGTGDLASNTTSRVVAEFEGSFNPKAQRFDMHAVSESIGSQMLRHLTLQARNDANTTLPTGSFTWRQTDTNGAARDSIFISTGDLAGTWSSEIQLTNNTSYTFYNTRLVFDVFRNGSASGSAATNSPATGGLAFYNDGLIAYNGKLNVSRNYGDMTPGASSSAIWTFAVPTNGPTFYFHFQILADLGVAAESVEPAAVQVNGSTGSTVQIHGRGFNGTPSVTLLNTSGTAVATLPVTNASATDLTVNIPAGTSPNVYSVRVTNPGGIPGGVGSSTLSGRLTVTGQPNAAHILSSGINALSDTGPYLVQNDATFLSDVTILPGTVIYVASGVTLRVAAGANITANGGIPGVPNGANVTTPQQIVFTANRAPGAVIPSQGAWNGIDATSGTTAKMIFRNTVIEYGGLSGSGQINLTGSGRTLQFTDSISRKSAGAGILALGVTDGLSNFSRSRLESNGTSASDAAVILSGNAALGLYDLDGTTGGTSVGDANFFYSSANAFTGNANDAVQIGSDAQANSNDFTKSGVLVGQGTTPIEIRGNGSNPATIGNSSAPGAELSIGPCTTIHLAPGLDLQAGDAARGLFGGIAANGFAGVTQVPGAAFGSSQYIIFDKAPSGSNFGAIFFSHNSSSSSILNFVKVQHGGASVSGQGQIISDGVMARVKNSVVNNSLTNNLLQINGGSFDTTNTDGGTPVTASSIMIDTLAGGGLGDGNPASKANFVVPTVMALDAQGRGIYVADNASPYFIRFINTSASVVTLAGQTIAAGTTRVLAGGGGNFADNVAGLQADVGTVTGLGVSLDGSLLYFNDASGGQIRALNISTTPVTVGPNLIAAGNVGTLTTGFGSGLNWMCIHPGNGNIYVADATPGTNKIFRVDAAGNQTVVAGNGASTQSSDPLPATTVPTNVPLMQPRAVEVDAAGTVYIADTGHARILKISSSGTLSLLDQSIPGGAGPYPNGLALFGGKLYIGNGNDQTISKLAGINATVAGQVRTGCDFSTSNCGDGGLATNATLSLLGGTADIPIAGIKADANGLFIPDQGGAFRGRIRYFNLSTVSVTIAGVTIAPNTIKSIAGTGLLSPYDGGLATAGAFNAPIGVAVDANNNLYVTESVGNRLRFVNRGATALTIFAGTAAQQVVPPGGIVTINKDNGTGATSDGISVNFGSFELPQGLAVTTQGVFIADSKKGPSFPGGLNFNSKLTGSIRFINTTSQTITMFPLAASPIVVPPGNVVTIAGGGNATSSVGNVRMVDPTDVAVNPVTGDIYVSDVGNKVVLKIDKQTGVISTVAGLSNAQYTGIAFDASGQLYVANYDTSHVLRQSAPGSSTWVQMDAASGLDKPRDLVIDAAGNAYVTNSGSQQIIKISAAGTVTVLAGAGRGLSSDPGLALNALMDIAPTDYNFKPLGTPLNLPRTVGITISQTGEIIFADTNNHRVRRLR